MDLPRPDTDLNSPKKKASQGWLDEFLISAVSSTEEGKEHLVGIETLWSLVLEAEKLSEDSLDTCVNTLCQAHLRFKTLETAKKNSGLINSFLERAQVSMQFIVRGSRGEYLSLFS